jgi:2-amino-4-hydroxy-6-hydroxymethyldihydropteridine diphosphokinase
MISVRQPPWSGPQPVILALGSNQGPRRDILEQTCRVLDLEGIRLVAASRVFETRPFAGSAGPNYLNACLAVRTRLPPRALLARCKAIERRFGRIRRERWAPRPLDIDLIIYDTIRLNDPELTLPHPGLKMRDFVLAGLLDLGVGFPEPGCRSRISLIRNWLHSAETCIVSTHPKLSVAALRRTGGEN